MEEFLAPLSKSLQPYKDHIAQGATIITILQLLSPALLVNEIRKAKTTKNFTIAPFIGGGVLSIMFVVFGQLMNDPTTIKVNMIGVILSVIYITAFYIYTPIEEKFNVWFKVGLAGAFSAIMIGYTKYEDPNLVEQRFGLILTLLLYAVIASPMTELKEVIRNKSTEGLPFPIIFMGFLVGLSWLTYGVVLNNAFIILQNLVVVLLCGFQLSFFLIYPSKKVVKDKKKRN
ncbi:hypothetical protein PVAND_003500 [Polypedilum vanderplanki]|uniref:Sugar transporter SWEET n=1 Tax=Polypedilum vanderplanki TaxID=319348 RepID=A0A9J6BW08_POLVA|nr:hypothetical protein PVAND_003500 [Polypedilum vanderplanki]